MEAAGAGAGVGAGDPDEGQEGRECQQGQQGLGVTGAEAAVLGEAQSVSGPQQVPGPGRDAFSMIGRPETQLHEMYPTDGTVGNGLGKGREKSRGYLGWAGHRSENRVVMMWLA